MEHGTKTQTLLARIGRLQAELEDLEDEAAGKRKAILAATQELRAELMRAVASKDRRSDSDKPSRSASDPFRGHAYYAPRGYAGALRPAIRRYMEKVGREVGALEIVQNVPEAEGDKRKVRIAIQNAKAAGEIEVGRRRGFYRLTRSGRRKSVFLNVSMKEHKQ